MKFTFKKILLKTLKFTGIAVGSILLLLFLLPLLFPHTVTKKIEDWANGSINGKVTFSNTRLSFFKHFPSLTLTLYDVDLKGSAPFEKDTLVAAKEISLGIDLSSLMKEKISIDKIYLSQALINIQVDSSGRANYNVYKSTQQKSQAAADTSGASLGIDQILVEKSTLIYNDKSLPMKINARGFNYSGSGDLTKAIFDLHSHTEIQSLDFYYGGQSYVISKKVNADLLTQINTKSLAFAFQKNDLMINQLPVKFTGRFEFLKDGYDMDFRVNSNENDLSDIFTAMPSAYQKMLAETEVNGKANIQIALTGKYIVKDNIKPDLSMSFKVRNGYIDNKKSPSPVRNLYLNMDAKVPGLNPDSLYVNIDSVYFNIDKGYFGSVIRVRGLKQPNIYAKVNTEIDLEKWSRAFGVKPVQLKGRYSLHLLAQGKYATGTVKTGPKKVDTIITSIPKFTLKSSFKDGYFKYASLPQAINNINFELDATCPDNNYKHTSLAINNINITALNNYIKGYFKLSNAADFPIDAELTTKFHLADIKQFYPIDSLDLKGDLDAAVKVKGKYIAAKKKFPVIIANINMKDGSIQTKYYPHPIQKIQISTSIVDRTGNLAGMKVFIKPISFEFENEPFMLKAKLQNFANIDYNVNARGVINVGKIYKVFAQQGYNVNGTIAANLSFKGKQSDVQAGRYDQLSNSGTLKVNNIALTANLFPKPLLISKGVFSFNQDKMQFDAFTANYGSSVIVLNGNLSNVLDYAMKPGSVLNGNFNLTSDLLAADDFMTLSTVTPASTSTTPKPVGVIMVPHNINLSFAADVKKVKYNGMVINKAKGQMTINNGNITLKQTGFNLIGAPIGMDATYTPVNPKEALFSYHISAKDFDIKKAYNRIKLFHDMATAAAYAEGLVSLDYNLSGKLDRNMQPVYPSLKGGGVLSAKQIKMRGFKLLGAVGKTTNHDSLANNPDVTQVSLKTTIANNIITIEQTKMRIAGFRVRFEGQASFSKAINLQFRLGLPPLGIIGIPMHITGTQDNPKIQLGKSKKEDELQAVTDDSN